MAESERATAGEGADEAAPSTTAVHRTEAHLVRQPLAADDDDAVAADDAAAAEAVASIVEDRRPDDPRGTDWLLPGDEVVTVSLFSEREPPALVWFVELAGEGWSDPADEIRRRSPLFDADREAHLAGADTGRDPGGDGSGRGSADDDDADVTTTDDAGSDADAGATDARSRIAHLANPGRPATPDEPDVVLVDLDVRSGPGTWGMRLVAGALDRLLAGALDPVTAWPRRQFEAQATEIVADERMWTETLWLERRDGRYAVRWYMEADDLGHAQAAYEAAESGLARLSDALIEQLFGASVDSLADPRAASETLLAHATAADRS